MKIVPYSEGFGQCNSLAGMLKAEGIPKKDMCFTQDTTFLLVTDVGYHIRGFYTERQDAEGLTLKHFCVPTYLRNSRQAWALWLHFKKRHSATVSMWSVNISKSNEKLKRLLQLATNVLEIYHTNEHEDFYLVSFRR